MQQNRIEYIDVLKGIAILCIMLLHYEDGVFSEAINRIIGSFMITAFYVSSGIIYSMKTDANIDFIKFAKKRFRQIMVPYFLFSVIIITFDLALMMFGERHLINIAKDVYVTVTFRGIGTLWFLPVLYVGELVFVKAKQVNKLMPTLLIAVIAVCLTHTLMAGISNNGQSLMAGATDKELIKMELIRNFVMTMDRIFDAIIILSITYVIHRKIMNYIESVFSRLFAGAVLFCVGTLAVICNLTGMIVSLILPLVLPYGLALMLSAIRKNPIGSMFQWFGRNSLIVMTTHYSFLLELCRIFDKNIVGGDFPASAH